ncbi:MAG: O-antigen ligase family protein, partial [Gaiellaceae bacterium]
ILLLLRARISLWLLASAVSLAALGAIALASPAWGGLPDIAWKTFDEYVVAAYALLLGSLVSGFHLRGRRLVLGGVLGGSALMALELLYRLQAGTAPASWFDGRKVDGPVQYHNAQGAFFALGIPLALWATVRAPAVVRAAGGLAVVTLTAALLVTQSRGALLSALAAVVLQLAFSRDARLLAHAVLAALIGGALVIPLRHVDAALVSDHGAATQFRALAGSALVGAIVLAGLCVLPRSRTIKRAMLGLVAIAVAALLAAAAPRAGDLRPAIHRALNGQEPTTLPGGETRLSSLSLTGRTQIWRVAIDAYRDAPLLGHGSGSFTAIFTRERTNHDLYVLQPHSTELEVLDELGLPGAAAFAAFLVFLAVALVRGRAPLADRAAGGAVVVALLAQASIDWTFSFPALVVATLLVAGAAAGRGGGVAHAAKTAAGGMVVAVAVLAALAGPYLATHDLSRARSAKTTSARTWDLLRKARGFDPWNADVVDYQAQVAEGAGRFQQAAGLYGEAAKLARLSWVEEYRRARALRSGGFIPASRAACRRARSLNPLERLLEQGPCRSGA